MDIIAKSRYLRIAPRKVRLIADLVRGMNVEDANIQLAFLPQSAGKNLKKILASAIASAEVNYNASKLGLFIKEITVDGGPVLKRYRPRAFGRAYTIAKRTSHVTMILDSRVPVQAVKADKRKKADAPSLEASKKQRETEIPKKPHWVPSDESGRLKRRLPGRVRQFFQRKSI